MCETKEITSGMLIKDLDENDLEFDALSPEFAVMSKVTYLYPPGKDFLNDKELRTLALVLLSYMNREKMRAAEQGLDLISPEYQTIYESAHKVYTELVKTPKPRKIKISERDLDNIRVIFLNEVEKYGSSHSDAAPPTVRSFYRWADNINLYRNHPRGVVCR